MNNEYQIVPAQPQVLDGPVQEIIPGLPIEMLIRDLSGSYQWRTAIVDRLDDPEPGMGIATCWVDGKIREYKFACLGFEFDPRVRRVRGKAVS